MNLFTTFKAANAKNLINDASTEKASVEQQSLLASQTKPKISSNSKGRIKNMTTKKISIDEGNATPRVTKGGNIY